MRNAECSECDNHGWVHSDNGVNDPKCIGYAGHHVEACDTCRTNGDGGDIQAELKHRLECGCGWGLPKDGATSTWCGYRGRNSELLDAFVDAGFIVSAPGDEDIVFQIHDHERLKFISTLDRTYALMLSNITQEDVKTDKKGALRALYGRQIEKHLHNSPFPKETFYAHLCKTGRESYESESLSNNAPRKDPGTELLHASRKLINQLDGMNFQDHTIKEQRELQERRREVVTKMMDLSGWVEKPPATMTDYRAMSKSMSFAPDPYVLKNVPINKRRNEDE